MFIIGHPLLALVSIADTLLFVYSLIVLAVCILSFVNPDPSMPLVRILRQLTEPVFARVRRYIPNVGMLDLTPLAVLVIIMFTREGILRIFEDIAKSLL